MSFNGKKQIRTQHPPPTPPRSTIKIIPFVVMPLYSRGWRHRPAAPFGLKSGSARTSLHLPAAIMTPCWGCVDLGAMLDPSWAMLGPCWGYVELCWDHVGSCSVKIGARLAGFGGTLGLWLAERAYVGPFWSFVGAMLAHLGSMLGPSSPI